MRANLIARTRNSKGGSHGHGIGYLLLKAAGPDVTWQRGDGVGVDISAATRSAGVPGLVLARLGARARGGLAQRMSI